MSPQTQPVPNPMAYYLHRSPWWFHRFETLSNHFIELLVPFFLFLGRRMCILHGGLQILFQVGCAKVPPLGVPMCLQKTTACLIIYVLAQEPRGEVSPAPSHPLQGSYCIWSRLDSRVPFPASMNPWWCLVALRDTDLAQAHLSSTQTLPVFLNPTLKC